MSLQFKWRRSGRLGGHERGRREGAQIYRLGLGIASALEIESRVPTFRSTGVRPELIRKEGTWQTSRVTIPSGIWSMIFSAVLSYDRSVSMQRYRYAA